jgi:hypothetical protein
LLRFRAGIIMQAMTGCGSPPGRRRVDGHSIDVGLVSSLSVADATAIWVLPVVSVDVEKGSVSCSHIVCYLVQVGHFFSFFRSLIIRWLVRSSLGAVRGFGPCRRRKKSKYILGQEHNSFDSLYIARDRKYRCGRGLFFAKQIEHTQRSTIT